MKKFLLLAVISCFLILQTKIVFGKCDAVLSFVRYPDMFTGWADFGDTAILFISPGDTITFIYNGDGICHACQTIWKLDGNIIQQGYFDTLNVTAEDTGDYYVYKYGCNAPYFYFQVIASSPSGIYDPAFPNLPFPFSQSHDISTTNLRYSIINPLGQIMEQGNFSGEIILRSQKPLQPLPAGIYFVIYSDALDNRQVLTDKVFVINQ